LSENEFNNSRDETYARTKNISSLRNSISLLKHVTQCRCNFFNLWNQHAEVHWWWKVNLLRG